MNPTLGDPSRLSDDELDQLEQLLRKSLGMRATPSITDVVGVSGEQQDKATQLPKKMETLSIFLRHETTLMNLLIKTLGLLRTLQSKRAAAEAEVHTIDGQRV